MKNWDFQKKKTPTDIPPTEINIFIKLWDTTVPTLWQNIIPLSILQ